MFYSLKGYIDTIKENYIVIDVHDVCYQLLVSHSEDYKIDELVRVYTYQVIREDEQFLVGFLTIEEKEIFENLISVKGIGPRTAINALSQTRPTDLKTAILTSNVSYLKKLPGIGAKAAAQIILDLKGSLKQSSLSSIESKTKFNKEQEDAISVLKSLGFKGKDIEDILNKLPEVLSASEYVNEVLKRLGNK